LLLSADKTSTKLGTADRNELPAEFGDKNIHPPVEHMALFFLINLK
jgi:hypothetical protein